MAYRHQQGFDHALAAMAVVVQQMVPCEVAGVGFSINPVTGDLNEMVVDANFGLGESVVSGEGEVDHFAIDRSPRAVRSANIARKSRKIVWRLPAAQRSSFEPGRRRPPCLGREQLARVDRPAPVAVEASYRFPQDIEWGLLAGQLFLLQSRPITTDSAALDARRIRRALPQRPHAADLGFCGQRISPVAQLLRFGSWGFRRSTANGSA